MITSRVYREGDEDKFEYRPDDDWGLQEEHIKIAALSYPCWTVLLDGKPIALFGVWKLWTGAWEPWAAVSDEARGHGIAVTREAVRLHREFMQRDDCHRLAAMVRADKTEYMRWLDLMGYEREFTLDRAFDGRIDVHSYRFVDYVQETKDTRARLQRNGAEVCYLESRG